MHLWVAALLPIYLLGSFATAYVLWRTSRRLGPVARARVNWWYLAAAVVLWPLAVVASALYVLA